VYSEGLAERTWGEALAAHDPARWDEAQAHFAASVAALETAGDLVHAAHTHAVWGELAQARGETEIAREHLEKAAAQYEASKFDDLLNQVRHLMTAQ
jgi:hypothetical protein